MELPSWLLFSAGGRLGDGARMPREVIMQAVDWSYQDDVQGVGQFGKYEEKKKLPGGGGLCAGFEGGGQWSAPSQEHSPARGPPRRKFVCRPSWKGLLQRNRAQQGRLGRDEAEAGLK